MLSSLLDQSPPADRAKLLKALRERLIANANNNNENNVVFLETLNQSYHYQIPFSVIESENEGERPFLTCSYNAIPDISTPSFLKYRSPWTNKIHSVDDESVTTKTTKATKHNKEDEDLMNIQPHLQKIRALEATFNEVWNSYKNMYYGHEAVGSVFLKDTEDGTLDGIFGIQKKSPSGTWDSISFVKVDVPGEKECQYSVKTAVLLVLKSTADGDPNTNVEISLMVSKDVTKTCKITPDLPIHVYHMEHVGELIEANEIDLRSNLEKVLIPKNLEILERIQKKEDQHNRRPPVNPLMGMVMNSDMLKKKLAQQLQQQSAAAANNK
jgi:hypothetical protein